MHAYIIHLYMTDFWCYCQWQLTDMIWTTFMIHDCSYRLGVYMCVVYCVVIFSNTCNTTRLLDECHPLACRLVCGIVVSRTPYARTKKTSPSLIGNRLYKPFPGWGDLIGFTTVLGCLGVSRFVWDNSFWYLVFRTWSSTSGHKQEKQCPMH